MLSQSLGLGVVYGGFAFFAALSFWFVKALLPEAKGLELEDETKLGRRQTGRSNEARGTA
ncbi:hypothetical protein [Sinomonas sp. P10A9]|uniref:Uncharacterized protein n=1 Tax=Sinomonas puerhi TaxID=3238584 RepID=A0AB39L719_9MICC